MDLYKSVSYAASELFTKRYSTSFSMSTNLFDGHMRPHIYAIYGLVRIADEIVDTYRGEDAAEILARLEADVYTAIERGYDTNPIIHAFALTAKHYDISKEIIAPFFESMAMDLRPVEYMQELYERYIYGSAEVVGLMCLKVFCDGDQLQYGELKSGATALGSAYQKVNFLRDIAADYDELGRLYFPGVTYDTFSEADKTAIVNDIEKDFDEARRYIKKLPAGCRRAVTLSAVYYGELLNEIKRTQADVLKTKRIRIGNGRKLWLYAKVRSGVV